MLAELGETGFYRTDLEATGEWIMRLTLKAPVYAGYRLLKALFDVDLRHRLGEVDVPLLILHGRHDQTCDPRWAEYMADRIDGAKLVWFEESAHYPMVEEPAKLSAEIAGFLQ